MWRYWNSEVTNFHTILGYKGILYRIYIEEEDRPFLERRIFWVHIRRLDAKLDSWVLRINVGFEEWEFRNLSPLSRKNYLVSMVMERISTESMQSTDFYE